MSAEEQAKILADYIITQRPYTPEEIARFMEEKSKLSSIRRFLEKVFKNKRRTGMSADEQNKIVDELTASEALFGFIGWLTSRPEPTVMSGHHNAGAPSDRVGEFMKANQLSEPRDGWQHKLVWVKEDEPLPMEPRRSRWCLYNFAFRVFGNTRLWPRLGPRIWN